MIGEKFQGVIHLRHGVSLEQPWDSFTTENEGTKPAGNGRSVYKTSTKDAATNNNNDEDEQDYSDDEL